MKNYRRIINVAYSFYPDLKSSEGIVNFNWQNILLKNSTEIVEISKKKYVDFSLDEKQFFNNENRLYELLKNKSSIGGIIYRILNKIFIRIYSKSDSLYYFLWTKKSYKVLEKKYNNESVVWSRILPVASIKPILKYYSKNKFPFVVNVNDPIVAKSLVKVEKGKLTIEEQIFLQTRDKAQAWTFPSLQLAILVAKKYNLDRERCFVIPHAYTPFPSYYKREKGSIMKILYTGTFYKSAFTNEFKKALELFQETSFFEKVEFTFVLSQYDESSIQWLQETIPNVVLRYKLDRDEVLSLLKKSDVMLVVDAETHTELLKGKLIEAISFGIPVFAATYKRSVMDQVVLEYGCCPAYQDVLSDLHIKLIQMIKDLDNDDWLSSFYANREKVINKFSEKSIMDATYNVTEFAFQRFSGNINYRIKNLLN
jgi:hypothetical protein